MKPLRIVALALVTVAGCTETPGETDAARTAIEVRTVRDDSTGAELPRVTLAGRPEVERLVNAGLDSLSASLTCLDAGSNTADTSLAAPSQVRSGLARPVHPASGFVTRASVAHAGDDVLSVSVHSSYDCGGPYPTNDANQSVTYDLTTGAAVPFATLFRDYAADRDAIVGVLQTTLFSAAAEVDSACADLLTPEALASTSFAYALSDAGLLVQPEFAHVVEACAVESTIPYGSLRAYAAEGGVLARVADGAGAPH